MTADAGKAFVDIVPKLEGFGQKLNAGVTPVLSAFSAKISGAFSALGPAGIAVGTAVTGAAVVGGAFLEVGQKFKDAYNIIAVKTGATGGALDKLKDSFKNVFTNSAGSFEQVAEAIGAVSVKTGLVGKDLEDFAHKQVSLARITKTEVSENVQITTSLFNKFGVAAKDQSRELDVLFKASQKSNVPVAQLADELQTGAAAMKSFGLSLDQGASLFAGLDKSGVSATKTTMALNKAFATYTKEGLNTDQARAKLFDLFRSIESGKDPTKNTAEALRVFGARSGNELIQAVKSGQFSVEGFLKAITDGKDGIEDTALSTSGLGAKFNILRHMAYTAMEPIASDLLQRVNDAFRSLLNHMPQIVKAFEPVKQAALAVGAGFLKLGGLVREFLMPAVRELVKAWEEKIIPALTKAAEDMLPHLVGAVDYLRAAFEKNRPELEKLRDWLVKILSVVAEQVLPALVTLGGVVIFAVITAIEILITTISTLVDVWDGLVKKVKDGWSGLKAVWQWIKDAVGSANDWANMLYTAGENMIQGLINGIESMASRVVDTMKNLAGKLKDAITMPLAIFSPSKVFHGYGVNIVQGLTNGLTAASPSIDRTMGDMTKRLALGQPGRMSGPGAAVHGPITINAPHGLDAQSVARYAAQELGWQLRTASR